MKNCNDCFYWDKKDELQAEAGRCSGQGPSATLVPMQGIGGQGLSVVTYWPETKASDRCAKWVESGISSAILQS